VLNSLLILVLILPPATEIIDFSSSKAYFLADSLPHFWAENIIISLIFSFGGWGFENL